MIKTPLSPTVALVENGNWVYAECQRCDQRLHGPMGRALPHRELEAFLKLHAHAQPKPLAMDEITSDVAKLKQHAPPDSDEGWKECSAPIPAKGAT